MKKNILLGLAVVASAVGTLAVSAMGTHEPGWPLFGTGSSYELAFNPGSLKSGKDESGYYHFVNGRGSNFSFETSGNVTMNSNMGLGTNGVFKTASPIHGITSITCDTVSSINVVIYLLKDGVQVATSGSTNKKYSTPDGVYADGFKITKNVSNVYIKEIIITYTCAEQGE